MSQKVMTVDSAQYMAFRADYVIKSSFIAMKPEDYHYMIFVLQSFKLGALTVKDAEEKIINVCKDRILRQEIIDYFEESRKVLI